MSDWITGIGVIVWLAVLAVTLMPLTGIRTWWVRMWDFPRIHVMIVALVLGVAVTVLASGTLRWAAVVMFACALYQASWIWRYTRFARIEVPISEQRAQHICLLAANVLMENDRYADVASVIASENPDVVLLMETDDDWVRALQPALQDYPTVMTCPQGNHYGMVFATRLPCREARFVDLADDDTPAVIAALTDRAGRAFHFLGLHPRPPVPGETTEARDEETRRMAELAGRTENPVIAMGDFNDVAWSWTSDRFKVHGGFLDPRIGRKMMASFDARYRLLRFPIDQLYFTPGVAFHSFGRGPKVGSDHFPMIARLSIADRKDKV